MAKVKERPTKKTPALPVLSHSAMEDLKRKIAVDESFSSERPAQNDPGTHLAASEVFELDKSASRRRIDRNRKAMETLGGSGRDIKGSDRQALEKEYDQLKGWLQERMLTGQEVDAFPSNGKEQDGDVKQALYDLAVKKTMSREGEMSPIFIQRAERFKGIARLLWPEDPERSNLNSIRPAGSRTGRHFG